MEVELKLQVDAQYRDAILHHPLLHPANASPPREQKQVDTYFDTPEMRLHRKRIGLRVRRVKNRWVQNVKGANGVNGGHAGALHSRGEWEWPVAGPTPEFGRAQDIIDDKQVRRGLRAGRALEKRLVPVFATRVRRTVWDLPLADGGQVECALDQGAIECGDKEVAVSELELELTAGDVGQLFDLALGLQQDIPIQLGSRSKAERGYALLAATPEQAVKAQAPLLDKRMTAEQAFVAIAANCLSHMQDNAQRVAQAHDVEALHQMRVGMRRLRSALAMFKKLLQLPEDLQGELDWLAGELGDTRDWDVLSGTTLPAVERMALDGAQLAGLRQAAVDEAHARHLKTAESVSSPRYTHLMLTMSRWLLTAGWRAGQQPPAADDKLLRPVLGFARQVIDSDQRRLRRRAGKLRGGTPAARHRLRIAAKKSRYAAEFFGSLFPAKTVRRYVKGLSALQDELGLLNDYAVAERLLSSLSEAHPDMHEDVGFVRGVLAAERNGEDKKVTRLWKEFAPLSPPQ